MKALKIFIVAAFLAAMGFLIYKVVRDKVRTDVSEDVIIIPDGCDLDWAQDYIDSVYQSIPNGEFKLLKERRSEMQSNFQNVMNEAPKKCQETVELILRNRYQSRFIRMANNEFDKKVWSHYSDIRDMNKALLDELSQGSSELKTIEGICKEFGQVVYYNNRVKKQSSQQPEGIYHRWDMEVVRELIGDTPSASAPVNHTAQYELSRPAKVKEILYGGHVSFLQELVKLAKEGIEDNPTRENYHQVCEIVSKEIERFSNNAASTYDASYSRVEEITERMNGLLDGYEVLVISDEIQD